MAREAARRVFQFTKRLPPDERYALSDQIRKSSRAVNAMIAEAWGRRRYKAVWISKLDEALGEANETKPGSMMLSMEVILTRMSLTASISSMYRFVGCFRE